MASKELLFSEPLKKIKLKPISGRLKIMEHSEWLDFSIKIDKSLISPKDILERTTSVLCLKYSLKSISSLTILKR